MFLEIKGVNMAIVDLDEDLNLVEPDPENADTIPPKEFVNKDETGVSLLYNKETPLDSIVSSLSGYRWTVTYYNQVRYKNDTLVQFDVTASATIQKYNRITNMLLYVQSPLSLENAQSLKGDALIRGDFLPNAHDVFLSTLPNGRLALFTVDTVEDRTSNLNKIYYIEYSVLHYIDGNSNIGILYNLNHKVVKKYVYDLNHLATKSSPLLLESTYLSKINLSDAYSDILDYYLKTFLSKKRGVLSIPTKDDTISTDVYLTEFLLKTVESSKYIDIHRLNRFPDDYYKDKPYTIFDILLNRRIKDLRRAETNMGYVDNNVSVYNPIVRLFNNKHGIRYVRDALGDRIGYQLEVKELSTYFKYFDSIKPEPFSPEDGEVTIELDMGNNTGNNKPSEHIEEPEDEHVDNTTDVPVDTPVDDTVAKPVDPDTNTPIGPIDPGSQPEVTPDEAVPEEVKPEEVLPDDKEPSEENPDIGSEDDDPTEIVLPEDTGDIIDEYFQLDSDYLPPILEDHVEYIFSKWFYSMDEERCGYIEGLVLDYLNGKPIDSKYLTLAAEQYHMWPTEQQYDLIPILLFLIKYYFSTLERL